MTAYYNDNDAFVCDWLENLIAEGLIADGDVDRRSIADVEPQDLEGYTQAHFFAGIGGWSYALRLAGWPDDRPVWTGSCPCQPFSAAGKRLGTDDARHLWPEWLRLIRECRPSVVLGEQVASKAGRSWLATVRADLEAMAYAVGCADLCAAGVGAPHIRQRLWFVADTAHRWNGGNSRAQRPRWRCPTSDMGHPQSGGQRKRRDATQQGRGGYVDGTDETGSMADTDGRDASTEGVQRGGQHGQRTEDGGTGELAQPYQQRRDGQGLHLRPGRQKQTETGSPWADCDWLPCRDGKARPTQPGLFPLATGIPQRVGRLRAYGNAIVPSVAAEFIRAYVECCR